MIKLNINHTSITASNFEPLIVGNTNSIFVQFVFSHEWVKLARVAVFSNGDETKTVSLTSDVCAIPWELLRTQGEVFVALRVLGDSGSYVLCTENVSLGKVVESNATKPISLPEEATPSILESLLADVAELKDTEYTYIASASYDGRSFSRIVGTYSEIRSAYRNGNIVELHLTIEDVGGISLPLAACPSDLEVVFEAKIDGIDDEHNFMRVRIDSNNDWHAEYSEHATTAFVTEAIEDAITSIDSLIGSGVIG